MIWRLTEILHCRRYGDSQKPYWTVFQKLCRFQKAKARERASKLNQQPVVACDRAKLENKVDKFQGCRIINLKYLISQLEDRCSLCGEVLHLVNLEDETRHGLVSLFYIKCSCGHIVQCIQANIKEMWTPEKKICLMWALWSKNHCDTNKKLKNKKIR